MPVEEFNSAKMLFWKRFMEMDENPKSKNDDVYEDGKGTDAK